MLSLLQGVDRALAQFVETCEIDDGAAGQMPGTVLHRKRSGQTAVMAPRGLIGTQKQWNDMNERICEELRMVNRLYLCLSQNVLHLFRII